MSIITFLKSLTLIGEGKLGISEKQVIAIGYYAQLHVIKEFQLEKYVSVIQMHGSYVFVLTRESLWR